MAVPTDPDFYSGTDAMATRLGTKAEDLLWVWASETAFDPTLSGDARTISTLMSGVVNSGLLTQAEWDSLPTLTAAKQLPFIERYYKLLHDRYLGGRGFQDTFELYLANAAPGLLRPDGQYNQASTMYGDPNNPAHTRAWRDNWPMDNFPTARTQASARGVLYPMPLSFGEQLVSEGLLKGWINIGDLKNFMIRGDVAQIANAAIQNLRSVRAGAGITSGYAQSTSTSTSAMDTTPYVPNFGKSFGNPSAPVDTRLAPSAPTSRTAFSPTEIAVLAVLTYFAIRWLSK
jgi:hypothetical protein